MIAGPAEADGCAERRESGQATVELALLLPVIMMLVLAVLQVGLVARDQVLVTNAAREAARAAAVDGRSGAALAAARRSGPLDPAELRVVVGRRGAAGSTVRVVVHYRSVTDAPLVGPLVGDVDLHAAATMRVEQ
ncbi:MAG: pilus assembly protein [Actinomycetota bacterium]|nr:pilus assembly protein [Actinomycetota bacterium]